MPGLLFNHQHMNLDLLNSRNQLSIKDKFAYILLFLFPVAGMSVRHWISGIFTMLVLLSIPYLQKRDKPLVKEEEMLIWILFSFFVVFMVTAVINGWTERQTKYLNVEIRYLLAIPLYLMMRQLPHAGVWILRGCLIGGVILGIQSFYDIEILNWQRATGIYSPNLIGPYAVLVSFWLIVALGIEKNLLLPRYLVPVSVFCAIYAVIMSGSRGAYLAFVVLLLIWFTLEANRRKVILVSVIAVLLIATVYSLYPKMSDRVNSALNEIDHVVHMDNNAGNQSAIDGIAARVEMWKASWMLIKENPVFGIGRGNYEYIMPIYIAEGRVSKSLEPHGLGHPHNAYLEFLVSKGIPGFLVSMCLVIYPLYLFIKIRRLSPQWSMLGIIHISGFMLFSLSDASTFIKGNYTAIFLVFLIVFYSHVIRDAKIPHASAT